MKGANWFERKLLCRKGQSANMQVPRHHEGSQTPSVVRSSASRLMILDAVSIHDKLNTAAAAITTRKLASRSCTTPPMQTHRRSPQQVAHNNPPPESDSSPPSPLTTTNTNGRRRPTDTDTDDPTFPQPRKPSKIPIHTINSPKNQKKRHTEMQQPTTITPCSLPSHTPIHPSMQQAPAAASRLVSTQPHDPR